MISGSTRFKSALVREDAYFSEIDQTLLANLRETLELQKEAEQCAAGNRIKYNEACGAQAIHTPWCTE